MNVRCVVCEPKIAQTHRHMHTHAHEADKAAHHDAGHGFVELHGSEAVIDVVERRAVLSVWPQTLREQRLVT